MLNMDGEELGLGMVLSGRGDAQGYRRQAVGAAPSSDFF
jgi:hypothetical protein